MSLHRVARYLRFVRVARGSVRLGATLALVSLAACSYFDRPEQPYRPPGTIEIAEIADGRQLYLRDCAWCHGNEGEGTARGPDLISGTNGGALTHFMLSTGRMPLGYPAQRTTHRDPLYDPQQIDAIVDHVAGFGGEGPEVPVLDLEGANLQLGLDLYQENCAACHSTTGVGGSLPPGSVVEVEGGEGENDFIVPGLLQSTSVEVAEAVRAGPGAMPVFGSDTFDDDELNAIVSYVAYLTDPDDEGGTPIGRIGPVAEGAVGWIVGLGVLVLLIRWIGTKRGEL